MNKDEAINLLNDMLLTCNVKEPYTEDVMKVLCFGKMVSRNVR